MSDTTDIKEFLKRIAGEGGTAVLLVSKPNGEIYTNVVGGEKTATILGLLHYVILIIESHLRKTIEGNK